MLSFPPSIFGSRILALFAATFVIHMLASIDLGLFFILIRFWLSLVYFRYTDKCGNFAVPVKMVFVNDNYNRCISGVFGWDFGLVLSKVFVACVRQLNAIFVFI